LSRTPPVRALEHAAIRRHSIDGLRARRGYRKGGDRSAVRAKTRPDIRPGQSRIRQEQAEQTGRRTRKNSTWGSQKGPLVIHKTVSRKRETRYRDASACILPVPFWKSSRRPPLLRPVTSGSPSGPSAGPRCRARETPERGDRRPALTFFTDWTVQTRPEYVEPVLPRHPPGPIWSRSSQG